MVKRFDWLPKGFYVFLIVLGIAMIFAQGLINDYCKADWLSKILRVGADRSNDYTVKHFIEYVGGDLLYIPFVITAKKWLNDYPIGYYACSFMFECLVIDIWFLCLTNPHEYNVSKWNMYAISFLIVVLKYFVDGRFNKNSIFRRLGLTK